MNPLHQPPPVHSVDFVVAVVAAVVFIIVMSLMREPSRQRFNAILVAGAGAAYLSSGLGGLELVFCTIMTVLAYRGLNHYAFIGAAWLLHSAWDAVHHMLADPIVIFAPTSSAGCAVADALIAIWFIAGAPDIRTVWRRARPALGAS